MNCNVWSWLNGVVSVALLTYVWTIYRWKPYERRLYRCFDCRIPMRISSDTAWLTGPNTKGPNPICDPCAQERSRIHFADLEEA